MDQVKITSPYADENVVALKESDEGVAARLRKVVCMYVCPVSPFCSLPCPCLLLYPKYTF